MDDIRDGKLRQLESLARAYAALYMACSADEEIDHETKQEIALILATMCSLGHEIVEATKAEVKAN